VTGWLLDTNVISEWRKQKPDRRVIALVEAEQRSDLYTSVVCFAELKKGASAVADLVAGREIARWLEEALRPYFGDRCLGLDEETVLTALAMIDAAKRQRIGPSVPDLLIAATAARHRLTVVTRNVKDFHPLRVPVLNPFTAERFNGA
jgi:toxin FitB